jgi:hypothetical protein
MHSNQTQNEFCTPYQTQNNMHSSQTQNEFCTPMQFDEKGVQIFLIRLSASNSLYYKSYYET